MSMLRTLAVICVTACAAVAFTTESMAAPAAKTTTKKQGGKLFKWVDKDGKVHYGDQVPPEYADQDKEQLNKQAQVVKKIDGAATPEEIAARVKQQQDEAATKQRAEHDKILLSTYSTIADLERARDARLAALRGQINIASSSVASLETEIARLEQAIAKLEAQRATAKDAKAIERIDQQLAANRRELNANQRQVMLRQDEERMVREQFAADIARFKELTGTKR